jgi:rhamnosyltransferase
MATASIITPTRNMERSIGHLLESIFSQEYDGGIEVLIMDSSDDRTPEIAQAFPVKIIRVEPEDYNYEKTRNEGAAIARGDFLVFISADVEIPDRRWLSKLTGHFVDPKVAGVYGRQLPKECTAPMEQFFVLHTYPDENAILTFDGSSVKTNRMVFQGNRI